VRLVHIHSVTEEIGGHPIVKSNTPSTPAVQQQMRSLFKDLVKSFQSRRTPASQAEEVCLDVSYSLLWNPHTEHHDIVMSFQATSLAECPKFHDQLYALCSDQSKSTRELLKPMHDVSFLQEYHDPNSELSVQRCVSERRCAITVQASQDKEDDQPGMEIWDYMPEQKQWVKGMTNPSPHSTPFPDKYHTNPQTSTKLTTRPIVNSTEEGSTQHQ